MDLVVDLETDSDSDYLARPKPTLSFHLSALSGIMALSTGSDCVPQPTCSDISFQFLSQNVSQRRFGVHEPSVGQILLK
jgi:hypothetical protein